MDSIHSTYNRNHQQNYSFNVCYDERAHCRALLSVDGHAYFTSRDMLFPTWSNGYGAFSIFAFWLAQLPVTSYTLRTWALRVYPFTLRIVWLLHNLARGPVMASEYAINGHGSDRPPRGRQRQCLRFWLKIYLKKYPIQVIDEIKVQWQHFTRLRIQTALSWDGFHDRQT